MSTDSLAALAHASRRTTVINEWTNVGRILNHAQVGYINDDVAAPGVGLLSRAIDALIDRCDNAIDPTEAWDFGNWPAYGIEAEAFDDLTHELADEVASGIVYTADVAECYASIGGWTVEDEVDELVEPGASTERRMRVALYIIVRAFLQTAGDRARAALR